MGRKEIAMKNFEHIAYMTNGAELVRTTCGEFANNTALPEIQVVRGSDMWDGEKSLAFGADLTAGKYTPAPTICKAVVQDADGNDIETLLVVDGQQRREAIRRCIAAGKLAPETPIDVIIVSGDNADDTFRRLNIGVTVAKSIVGSCDYDSDARKRINVLCAHPLFAAMGYSAYSRQNGIVSAVVQGAVAIVAQYIDKDGKKSPVWDSPSSNYTDAHKALGAHVADIPAAEWGRIAAMFDGMTEALNPYAEHIAKYGKTKKETAAARKLFSDLRKKNLFFSAVDAIGNGGMSAADVFAALTMTDTLDEYKDTPYIYTVNVAGNKTKLSARWTVGGGSSGSNADFGQRKIILSAVVAGLTDVDRKMALTVPGGAVDGRPVKAEAAAALMKEVG